MDAIETTTYAASALRSNRTRSKLCVLGVALGVGAVVLMGSLGGGTRAFILEQFTQFGSHIVAVTPGRTETLGIPGVLGGTTRKLTIDDAEALRKIPGVEALVPFVFGTARVERRGVGRSVPIYGVGDEVPRVWDFQVGQGRFFELRDPRRATSDAVLGPTLARELFGSDNPLGQRVRIDERRLRVIGVMEAKGQFLGLDLDDAAYVPVATGMQMFDRDEVGEIDLTFDPRVGTDEIVRRVEALLIRRHRGEHDFTVTSQDAMLAGFAKVFDVLTATVVSIAGISLLVGAVGILTVMWISVGQRQHEIGVLRAVGATSRQVAIVFLAESTMLSLVGGIWGVAGGLGIAGLLRLVVPGLPIAVSWALVLPALLISVATGSISGLLPARRAAAMDPVAALRKAPV